LCALARNDAESIVLEFMLYHPSERNDNSDRRSQREGHHWEDDEDQFSESRQQVRASAALERMRRAILERFRERYGEYPLGRINENFITAYLETLKPHAARNHLN
jgi:hypothetical protein